MSGQTNIFLIQSVEKRHAFDVYKFLKNFRLIAVQLTFSSFLVSRILEWSSPLVSFENACETDDGDGDAEGI